VLSRPDGAAFVGTCAFGQSSFGLAVE